MFGAYDSQVPETVFLVGLLLLVMRMREQFQTEEPVTATAYPRLSVPTLAAGKAA